MFFVHRICVALCSLILLHSVTAFGQKAATAPSAADFSLTLGGEVERPLKLSLADLGKLPRQTVQAKGHDGKDSKYEGVALSEVLRMAGVKSGKELKGKLLATYLLVEASDGYQVVFALPELDPAFTNQTILLANRRDDAALPPSAGPLQIIVPDEKQHSRWVRQVKSLTIRRA